MRWPLFVVCEKSAYSPINDIYKHMFGVIELRHLKTDRRNKA